MSAVPHGRRRHGGGGDGRVPSRAALLRRAPAAALLLAALAAVPAMAQDAAPPAASQPARAASGRDAEARESALARDNASGKVLDREELRRCIYEQMRLSAETDSIAEASRTLDTERAEIAHGGADLKTRAEALDRTDRAAVDAYNAQAEARNASIARHEAAAAKVGARIAAIEPARLAWSRDCANRPFRQEDRDAIEAGR